MLPAERLEADDISKRRREDKRLQAISVTHRLETVDDLPFTVKIITAEEILRNGYVTLADVLRSLPGFRVSQPGNAVEGETFLLRGLPGNRYMKILINDVPVKPSVALGMPVGAQLPIRQAGRIEVYYGPAGVMYGHEACAGVINIILKESERPIFTQADLGFGNLGYNSLDLMFGGRLGRDDKIFRFSLFGSSTVREQTDVFWNKSYYNASNYLPFRLDSSLYLTNPNFIADLPDRGQAFTVPGAHESRLFGLTLNWRGFNLTYTRMIRVDQTMLGLNPVAIGWFDISDRLSERLETLAVGFKRSKRKRTITNTLSAIRYRVSNASSAHYVFDRLSSAAYRARVSEPGDDAQLRREIFDLLAKDKRFLIAEGLDFRFESRISADIKPNLSFEGGLQTNLGFGLPLTGYFSEPSNFLLFDDRTNNFPRPFVPATSIDLDMNLFGQFRWHGKNVSLFGGAAVNGGLGYPIFPAPRVGALWHVDSSWSVFGNYSVGFRRAPLYAMANSFYIEQNTGDVSVSGVYDNYIYKLETMQCAELGFRRKKDKSRYELTGFYQQADRLARNGYFQYSGQSVFSDSIFRYGWENAPGRALAIWGIQGSVRNDILDVIHFTIQKQKFDIQSTLEFSFQYTRGKEWFGNAFAPLDDIRNQPRWMTQMRLFIYVNKFQLILASNRQTGALYSSVLYRDTYQLPDRPRESGKFRTWDIMMRLYLNNHFLLYFQVQNMFNREFTGLDATGTSDDLIANPQQRRLIRLGVNYNMN